MACMNRIHEPIRLAKRFDYLEQITDDLLQGADETGSKVGTGGMKSKLLLPKQRHLLGVSVFIGTGEGTEKLLNIVRGEGMAPIFPILISQKSITAGNGSSCIPKSPANSMWMKGRNKPFYIMEKAYCPQVCSKSKGKFHKGDVVEVFGMNGLLGKGEVSYSSDELKDTIEQRNKERIADMLTSTVEVIHRDRWAKI